jgi:primosomal protein N'
MQIQESIMKLFPKAVVCRFDTDSLQTVSAKKEAVNMLDTADIIIGTKMITTGFNIQNLGLIGVILIEQELAIPRYNTEENVYSNIRQLL